MRRDEFELSGGVLGIRGIAQADEGLSLFDGLAFLDEDVADDAGGGEGDLGIPDGLQASFGDDRAVGDHRRDGLWGRGPCLRAGSTCTHQQA